MNSKIDEIYSRILNGETVILGLGVSNRPLIDFLMKKHTSQNFLQDDFIGDELTSEKTRYIAKKIKNNANHISVYDKKSYEELLPFSEKLLNAGVELHLGGDFLFDLFHAQNAENTVVFRSPGFREDLNPIRDIVSRGAILSSEMELFLELTSATVIGITGSDGKTTTTTFIYKMLEQQLQKQNFGKAFVGGNIGEPLLPYVNEMSEADFAVVELSSFQLQTMSKSPIISVITNITPNHLNWHIDMNEYATAKKNIYLHQPCRAVVLNAENPLTASYADNCGKNVTLFSSKRSGYENIVPLMMENACALYIKDGRITHNDGETETPVIEISEIKLPGMHNVENCMCAVGALWGIVDPSVMRQIAKTFGGVEHRLEYVDNINEVDYYNSSIDSSPTRTAAALSAFAKKPLVICGGYDKNIPFEPLAETLCQRAKAVILTGATMEKIRDAIYSCPAFAQSGLYVLEESDFDKAFEKISSLAQCGDIVLLSPACASFDAFPNFEVRGEHYKDLVHKLKNCAIPTTK